MPLKDIHATPGRPIIAGITEDCAVLTVIEDGERKHLDVREHDSLMDALAYLRTDYVMQTYLVPGNWRRIHFVNADEVNV